MLHMEDIVLRGVCLLIGYGFGNFLTAELVSRAVTGQSAREIGTGNPGMANIMMHVGKGAGLVVLLGDILKTAAACWACWMVASPRIGQAALLYGGLGAVLGHNFPLWGRGWGGKGVTVTCTWLILCLPLTGALCCLAGGALVVYLGYLPLGAVVIPALAVPIAWVQFGRESGLVMLVAALLMLSRHYRGLRRIARGEEPRFFRKKGGDDTPPHK